MPAPKPSATKTMSSATKRSPSLAVPTPCTQAIEIQIRRTTPHPDYGPLRNGTTAQVDRDRCRRPDSTLQLADGHTITLDREQADRADLRLATSSIRSPPKATPPTPRT